MPRSIQCSVISPTGRFFEGSVAAIKGPGWEGRFGILPRHAPYLVRLLAGPLLMNDEQGSELFRQEIGGGFLMIAHDKCTILVENAEQGVKGEA